MGIEQTINQKLNNYPYIKRGIKNVYQHVMYATSSKIKSEGEIHKVSPNDDKNEYFFGYYDKSSWDATDRYMLCLKVKKTWDNVAPKMVAHILIIDTKNNNKVYNIAESNSWNVQQGCMLQWLGPEFKNKILFNDYRNNKYCSVILMLSINENEIKVINEKVINMPVYSVSANGKFALTLDFSRLHRLRPGYGYSNEIDKTKNDKLPDKTCIWFVDLENNSIQPVLKYTDFANFEPREDMQDAEHKVNHIMLNPSGNRFMILHRWFKGNHKYSRLITCNIDGKGMFNLSDDNMVSHCCWKNDNEILAFENKKKDGNGYYLMKDKTTKYQRLWKEIDYDGHPSYSPDRNMIVFDRYPDKKRIASIMISDKENLDAKKVKIIAKVFSPFKYDNDTRCDLHPRWNHAGDKICFDSVFEGHRGMYVVDVRKYCKNKNIQPSKDDYVKYSIITPMYNSFDLMKRYFDSFHKQTYKKFEIIIVDDCSTDNSYEKLVEYSLKSPIKLKVLRTKENAGPGNARNIGIDNADGEWITFVDNDDWVDYTFLEEIDDVINDKKVNCVIYDFYRESETKQVVSSSMYKGETGYLSISDGIKYTRNHSIGKFYKLEMIKNNHIYFPLLRRCEDVAFVARALDACETIFYYKRPLYHYYQRQNSLSNNNKLNGDDMIKAFQIIEDNLNNKYPKEIAEKSVTDLLYGCVLMMCKARENKQNIINYINWYNTIYPDWKNFEIVSELGLSKKIFLFFIDKKNIILLRIIAFIHSTLITQI